MNLPETLVYTDIAHLNRIAKQYQIGVNTSSKNELIQTLLQRILSQNQLEEQISLLSEVEKRYLALLLLDRRRGFTFEDLLAKASYILRTDQEEKGALPSNRSLVSTMINYGWVYQDKRDRGFLFRIPEDLRNRLLKGIRKHLIASEESLDIQVKRVKEPSPIFADLIQLLLYVQKEFVVLTADGVIHKRQQQQLLNQFQVKEGPIDGKEWRFGYGRRFNNYPNRFSLIYDYAFDKKYIAEETGVLTLTESGKALLEHPSEAILKDFYKFWVKTYSKPVKNLTYLISLIRLCASSQWVSANALMNALLKEVEPFFYDTKEDVLTKRILQPLIWMGCLDYTELDGKGYFKTSAYAETIFED